ncbi:MAG: sulfatase family protein [Planctomycetota bacterium]|jgi:arylsulfatase A-like enzyme
MRHLASWILLLAACGCTAPDPTPDTTRPDTTRTRPASSATSPLAGRRPNILFIFTDDHAVHAISAYGSKINKTPHIDQLAREGMLFRNCFCTNAICAPSRAVVLTGKHNHRNRQLTNRERFDGSQQTFPKLLQQAGYQTAMIGKWHLKSDPTGFDHWEILRGQGTYYNPVLLTAAGAEKHVGYCTDIVTDRSIEWLEKRRDSGKPFLLMCQHKAPHRNWKPGPEYLTRYDDVTIPEPDNLFDDWAGRNSGTGTQLMSIAKDLNNADLKLAEPRRRLNARQLATWKAVYDPKNAAFDAADLKGRALTRWKYQRYIKDYLRCVASVDDNIGRLLDYLERSGLAKDTVVIYSSDQGFFLGDHGWYDKRWMYEESLRMPFIVRWPGMVTAGSENRQLVQNLDFAQTFLALAGVSAPTDMQGESLVPLLGGAQPASWRQSVYYHYYEYPGWHAVPRHYGVRTHRYKLIHYYTLKEWELFDLQEDPREMHNRYGDPAHAGVVAELKTELKRLREQYQVPKDTRPTTGRNPR